MPPPGVSALRRRRPPGRRAHRLLAVGLMCAVVVGVTGCSTPPDPTTVKATPTSLASEPTSATATELELPDAAATGGGAPMSTGDTAPSRADRHAAPLARRQQPSMRSLVIQHLRPVARSSSSWTARSAEAGGATVRSLWRNAADVVAAVAADDPAGTIATPVGRTPRGRLADEAHDPAEERGGVEAMMWILGFAGLLHGLMLWSSIEDRRRQVGHAAEAATDTPHRAAWEDAVALIDARRAEGWQLPPHQRPSQPDGVWRADASPAPAGTSRSRSSSVRRGMPATTPVRPIGVAAVLPDDEDRDSEQGAELTSRVVIWAAADRGG